MGELKTSRCLILLDRDGVINENRVDYVKSQDEWQPIEGSLEAIKEMRNRYNLAICTNQSAVGKGILSSSVLDEIHQKMQRLIGTRTTEAIPVYACIHRTEEGCNCRKPRSGLLDTAITHFDADPSKTYFVGDSLSDMEAAANAGCIPILVRTGLGKETERAIAAEKGISVFDDLRAFSESIRTD